MALHCAGAKYTDQALSMEQFGAMKVAGEFPLGSVPVWIEDGEKFCGSNTLLRMIGLRHGMYPTDPECAWAVDSAMEAVEDNMAGYGGYLTVQVMQQA